MLQEVESIFENMESMLKEVKKKTYEENMKEFYEKNEDIFLCMTKQLEVEIGETTIQQTADAFIEAVKAKFGKRGKIKGYLQIDLNFFMIYYVFPAILMTKEKNAKLMADTLCENWGKSFKNSIISYTDYDTLHDSFKEKIWGIIEV